ncbi:conjugal transfer protein TraF [Granulosicoccus antarcticus]|uniref:Conjugal transfer protein TraF n=1 Tax=Granulosicoccus antarcticus IMCC3135 TaxID=1192854 RepID=A0A2Z2NW59_9GAMM|nr:conjugal transfer protein TraF [Granulosicoccus antarcticus]ASJ71394.1 hypothetical protein IMCC3135_06435 [Granulosicoccus antarcticus IMCC3135]
MSRPICSNSFTDASSVCLKDPRSPGDDTSANTLTSSKVAAMVATALLTMTLAAPAWSADARSIALGGSVIANGQGVHGAVDNPASLMAMQQRKETFHFSIGMAAEVRDSGEAIDTLTDDDNENLFDDIDDEVAALGTREVQCDPFSPSPDRRDQTCVDGTTGVANLSTQLLDILDTVDDETIDAQATLDMGVAFTSNQYPIAVNLRVSGTASGTPDIAEGDRTYITDFQEVLGDDVLTLGEAEDSPYLEADALGATLQVQQPEDVLTSEAHGSVLIRTQLGISIASSFKVGKYDIDAGITPKISALRAYDVLIRAQDEFDDSNPSIEDRLDDSEATENSFTLDAGASMALHSYPVRLAAVLRNIIPESIKTANDFEFETTPQLIVGALYQYGMLSVSGDLALNEAKVDNFETQKMGLGLEFGTAKLAIRGGVSIDNSRDTDATSLSLGVGLGPLQIGARLNGLESLEAGFQLAYSF